MRDYYTNQRTLEKLDEMLNNPDFISGVDSITIFGSASLIGSFQIKLTPFRRTRHGIENLYQMETSWSLQ